MLSSYDYGTLAVEAPADTLIVRGRVERQLFGHTYVAVENGDGSQESSAHGYTLLTNEQFPATIEHCGGGLAPRAGICGGPSNPEYASINPTSLPGASVDLTGVASHRPLRGIIVAFGCLSHLGGPEFDGRYCRLFHPNPRLAVGPVEFTVEDNVKPELDVWGALWDDAVATEPTLTVDVADRGLGMLDAEVYIDGQLIHRQDLDPAPTCTFPDHVFDTGRPCVLDPPPITFAVPGLSDGRHRILVQVRDLALNTDFAKREESFVVDLPPPSPTTAPFVTGAAREGGTLTANPGEWDGNGRPVSFEYQWQRCEKASGDCLDIAGATSQRYTPGSLDLESLLRVAVTGANQHGARTATTPTVGPVVGLQCFGTRCEIVTVEDEKPLDSPLPANGAGASPRARVTAGYGNKRVVRMGYGQRLMLRGRLADERGGAISGARLEVLARSGSLGSAYSPVGQVTTAADGSFSYLTPVGASRVIRFGYRALQSDLEYASAADVELIVQARVSFRATKRVRAGQSVRLGGSVAGIRPGTRLEIQARDRRTWRTFKTVRTRKDGSFASSYVFKRVPRPLSYLFRVVYRKNPSVPLESARSKAVRVRVRP